MSTLLEKLAFVEECLHAAREQPFAWRPGDYLGHFPSTEIGERQQQLCTSLMSVGYERKIFQLVFPGQIAGIVRNIPPNKIGYNEHHVRFLWRWHNRIRTGI